MHTRRSFLKSSALYSAGILAAPSLSNMGLADSPAIGLQLYTVRDQMKADPKGTLAQVAKIGYNSLEGATYTGTEKFYGMDPRTFSGVLKQNGLVMRSCHYRLGEDAKPEDLTNGVFQGTILHDWQKSVDDAAMIGIKYMVCAWLSEKERVGMDHYKKMAEWFNSAGMTCKKAGIQFCYHNHDFEFDKQGGSIYPYDVLLNNTDPNLVKMEMDMYWVTKAGQDPQKLIDAHPGRFPLWHLKDMDNTPKHSFTEVGNGVIDFKKIFKLKSKAGMKYFFVEQDQCPGSPFDSIAKSMKYIKANLI